MNDPRGSVWRKWDLHFHTPSSFDYQNKSITNDEIIQILQKNNISAIAITDHNIIDVERITKLKEIAKDGITIFPGIELRSVLGGKESVHFIGIFPEDSNYSDIAKKIEGKLDLTDSDISKKGGHEKIYCDLIKSADCIHELGGIVTVHAGKKTNSIENISNIDFYKRAFKSDLLHEYIDILEISTPSDINDYQNIVFPTINKELTLIKCSDNHNILDYPTTFHCWVKADATFKGLHQVLKEKNDRIYIGETPEIMNIFNSNKDIFIDSISIRKIDNSKENETWFDNIDIKFNHQLIGIIGRKGMGKSALADIIALLGNTSIDESDFSFLNIRKFRDRAQKKANNFKASIHWGDNSDNTILLSENVEKNSNERIKYIPQNYFETICNEILSKKEGGEFHKQLKQAIFSHVKESDKLGCESLDDLADKKTAVIKKSIDSLKTDLYEINKEIANSEDHLSSDYKNKLVENITKKRNLIDSLKSAIPQTMEEPHEDENIKNLILDTKSFQEILEDMKKQISSKLKPINEKKEELKTFLNELDYLRGEINIFVQKWESKLQKYQLDINDIIQNSIETETVTENLNIYERMVNHCNDLLDDSNNEGIDAKISQVQNTLTLLISNSNSKNQEYQEYLNKIENIKKDIQKHEGSEEERDTLKFYEKSLQSIETEFPTKLINLKEIRVDITKKIFIKLLEIKKILIALYMPVQEFIKKNEILRTEYKLDFNVNIIINNFSTAFLNYINNTKKSYFSSKYNGISKLNNILDETSIETIDDVIKFINDIMNKMELDLKESGETVPVKEHLKNPDKINELYDYIYSLEFLIPEYALTLDNKDLQKLSPGERGVLLLIFYLLVDKSNYPLILDQPEENLDNQSIVDFLVPCIRTAKKHRQIFMVTHNPNLAVVCDAEQIVHCSIDSNNNYKVNYTPGSIENPATNKKIVDILEGTMPAFQIRKNKIF